MTYAIALRRSAPACRSGLPILGKLLGHSPGFDYAALRPFGKRSDAGSGRGYRGRDRKSARRKRGLTSRKEIYIEDGFLCPHNIKSRA